MTSSGLSENARSPIIGLFGFVLTSMHGAKFKFIPYSASSFDISSDCSFKTPF